jgi:hypothetical protein
MFLKLYRNGLHSSFSTVAAISDILSQCRRLSLVINDAQSLHIVADTLVRIHLDAIEVLSIVNNGSSRTLASSRMVDTSYNFSKLRSLRLIRIWFNWDLVSTFSSLTTLVLRDIHAQFSPSWSMWLTIQRVCTGLEKLCLADVCCSNIPSKPSTLQFGRITDIHIVLSSDHPTAYALVASLDIPAVMNIIFQTDDDSTLLCLIEHDGMLDQVTNLVLDLFEVSSVPIVHALFIRMPNLVSLDVLSSDICVLDGLFTPFDSSSFDMLVCPYLTHLIVDDETPRDVRRFMERRSRSVEPLKTVIFHSEVDFDTHFHWLDNRVEVLTGIPFVEPEWIAGEAFYSEGDM